MYSTFIHEVHTEDIKNSVDCIRNQKKKICYCKMFGYNIYRTLNILFIVIFIQFS